VFSSDFNEGTFVTLDGNGSIFWGAEFEHLDAENNSVGFFNKEKGIFRFLPNMQQAANAFGTVYLNWANIIYCEKYPHLLDDLDERNRLRETYSGKVMGLCAYGNDLDFSLEKYKMYATSKERMHEFPFIMWRHWTRVMESPFQSLSPEHKAYAVQKNFEFAMLEYFKMLKEKTFLDDNLCLAGGVFLNVPVNSLLKQSGLVKNIHIPPYTSDTGLHFGAATYYSFKNKETIELPENIALLGKEYTEEEIEDALKEGEVNYEKYESFDEVCNFTVNQIVDSKIIGWFQGKSEQGPRALGSRSLLMSPSVPDGKDIINSRVKHREYWRPFAGIILDEDLTEYFEEDFCSPYMLYSLTVREDKRDKIPAITHKDNTCRIQTVNDTINPKVTKLLNKLKETCGSSVVLNTSFNDNGEPIVETPQDAVRSFKNMDIDYLVIGNFVVRK
jgi:carbamoyltransferase